MFVYFIPGCYLCLLLDSIVKQIKTNYPSITFVHVTNKTWKGLKQYMEKHNITETLFYVKNDIYYKTLFWAAPTINFINQNTEITGLHIGYPDGIFLYHEIIEKLSKF